MPDDRFSQIAQGARGATGYDEWEKIKGFMSKLFPKRPEEPVIAAEGRGGDLAEEIAGVSRMVQEPESTSEDWLSMGTKFMETGDLQDATDEELMMLLEDLLGREGADRESMIDDLETYRSRMMSR